MPSKSRRKRGKQSFHGRKGRRQAPLPTTTPQPAATPTHAPEATPSPMTGPSQSTPTPTVPAAARYPYVAGELKRIGIMAGIMVAVLVILSRVVF